MEVNLDIYEKVKCTEFDLASDDERKIWASCFQITICTGHLTHVLGKIFRCWLIGHVLHKTRVVEL
jgi:hypothetical protein